MLGDVQLHPVQFSLTVFWIEACLQPLFRQVSSLWKLPRVPQLFQEIQSFLKMDSIVSQQFVKNKNREVYRMGESMDEQAPLAGERIEKALCAERC